MSSYSPSAFRLETGAEPEAGTGPDAVGPVGGGGPDGAAGVLLVSGAGSSDDPAPVPARGSAGVIFHGPKPADAEYAEDLLRTGGAGVSSLLRPFGEEGLDDKDPEGPGGWADPDPDAALAED